MQTHVHFMQKALALALKGAYQASPNPMVGAVIVKNNVIVAERYHQQFGQAHAEVNALKPLIERGEDLSEATLYCTLEPCCHTNKKTPPCTELIIQSGIKNVVIASLDANPQVKGQGVDRLRQHGIQVTTGICEIEANELNRAFFHRIQNHSPYIIVKWAQSLDGKIALTNGQSKWITSENSRQAVHRERLTSDVILTCAGTLRKDDPAMTARYSDFDHKTPWRVIVSASGEIPSHLQIFKNQPEKIAIIVSEKQSHRLNRVQDLGCQILSVPVDSADNLLSAQHIFQAIEQLGTFNQIYVEAGTKLLSTILTARKLHELQIFIAPMIIGAGVTPTEHLHIQDLKNSLKFKSCSWKELAPDLYFRGIIG
jgi:diaminohydroxyphosphoribosylaminopyrimidine deaminase / 5-amino-6-(5-phosphoribosylamino)uracil reductase